MTDTPQDRQPLVTVEMVTELNAYDISELSDATEEAIDAGGGFGWLAPPPRTVLEDYWRGVLLIPDVTLFLGKLDHVIAGSCQIVSPPRNNEAQALACQLKTFFLAPWARGHGLAGKLAAEAEDFARSEGFKILNLDVRATKTEPSGRFVREDMNNSAPTRFMLLLAMNLFPACISVNCYKARKTHL